MIHLNQLFRLLLIVTFSIGLACKNSEKQDRESIQEQAEQPTINPADTIPPFRSIVKKDAVASFVQKTDNPLNDWYFKVTIFETPKTFHFLMKMQYEEIRGLDTLKLPNLGVQPEVQIKKGPDPFSCIIGFLDKDKQFKEYKKVFVKNNVLKVVTLNHYVARRYRKEETK